MNELMLKDIVDGIKEAADALRAKDARDMVEQGELLGYTEALSIIQSVAGEARWAAIGLDFDVDRKYLF